MLPDLEPSAIGNVSADNVRSVQAIYFAYQLEQLRAFQVVERLAKLFEQGLLPLGVGKAARRLRRQASSDGQLSALQRKNLYTRALGEQDGESGESQPNRDFNELWLRFVSSVSSLVRQHDVSELLRPAVLAQAAAWRAARALALNTSAHGAGLAAAVNRLAVDANRLRAVLETPEILQAFGAHDMWQVIDRVSRNELGGAVNVVRYRTRAYSGSVVLQWLAAHSGLLSKPAASTTRLRVHDPALIDAAQQWLASCVNRANS